MEKLGFCLGWILACIFTLIITEIEYGSRNKSTFYTVAMLTGVNSSRTAIHAMVRRYIG